MPATTPMTPTQRHLRLLPSSTPSNAIVAIGFRRPRRPIRISDIMTGMPTSTTHSR